MAKTSEVISKLQQLVEKHGDRKFTIYNSFYKTTTNISADRDIFFDEELKDIYIGIYS